MAERKEEKKNEKVKKEIEKEEEEEEEFEKRILPFPIYAIDSNYYSELNTELVVVAGGGGRAKTGVPNGFVCFHFFFFIFI